MKCCGISAASKPAQAGSRFVCAGSRFCGAASLGLLPSRVTATGQVTTAIGKQFILSIVFQARSASVRVVISLSRRFGNDEIRCVSEGATDDGGREFP